LEEEHTKMKRNINESNLKYDNYAKDFVSLQKQLKLIENETEEKDNVISNLLQEIDLYKVNFEQVEDGFNKIKIEFSEKERMNLLLNNENHELIKKSYGTGKRN